MILLLSQRSDTSKLRSTLCSRLAGAYKLWHGLRQRLRNMIPGNIQVTAPVLLPTTALLSSQL